MIVFRSLQTITHLCDLHPFFPGADRFSPPNDAGWKRQMAQKFFSAMQLVAEQSLRSRLPLSLQIDAMFTLPLSMCVFRYLR